MNSVTAKQHVLVGTAGHIDHGKTRLTGRLTGILTDRLPEEKARGISIDLGFAHWESDGYQFGIIDVPGHERFVKNMVAGATGVNVALLVIAADDSVMPQTREHLEIMDLLGVRSGVIAVTKVDLVDSEMVELVRAEIEDLVAGTFLEGKPIVDVSSETGEGIDDLRQAITAVADELDWPESREVFRLPIDRVFSLTGHGTIVTGSVLSGEVHAGDTLDLLPQQRSVRVRSVETHGTGIQQVGVRRRIAVNLAGVRNEELDRGTELATPGFLQPTHRLVAKIRLLSSSPMSLKDRTEVSLHLGTTEVSARVITKGRLVKPGETAFVELRTKEPVVATHGQRFILRRVSPAVTIAGGTIADPFVHPEKRIRNLADYVESAMATDVIERLSFLFSHEDVADVTPLVAAWRVGTRIAEFESLCTELKSRKILVELGKKDRPYLIHAGRLAALSETILRTIRAELKKHQPRRSLPKNTLLTACREITRPNLLEGVFEHLFQSRELVRIGKNVGPADAQVKLTKRQRQTVDRILSVIGEPGLMPPTAKELAAQSGMTLQELEPLLNLCREDGVLVAVGNLLHYTPENLEQARSVCKSHLQQAGSATMSELREMWGVSRKFSVPLCEYFDSVGVTRREGDVRVAGPKIADALV